MPVMTILSVGLDFQLLPSRSLVLSTAGCIVVSASSLTEAIGQFQQGDFDLVLLCHSIPAKDQERLTCLIRASGSLTPVVTMADSLGQQDYFADAILDNDPDQFLAGVISVVAEARRSAKARWQPSSVRLFEIRKRA